jgi:hypothetical protein
MVFRVSITIFVLIVTAAIYSIMSNHKSSLQLTVKGRDDLGINLELPYRKDSPGDVIITNIGNHNPIAYKIRWEGIKYTGETVERQSIKCHILAVLEKNPDKRAELLQHEPLLASKSKWLIGLGRETMEISDQVPSLAFIGGRPPQVFPDLAEYKQINVTLEGIMLEDGQITGLDTAAFDKEIQTLVSKYLGRLNKEHINGQSKR